MNVFTLEDLQLEEITLLRQSLNIIEIKGANAQFVANLQIKLDTQIRQIQNMVQEEEIKKQTGDKRIGKTVKG